MKISIKRNLVHICLLAVLLLGLCLASTVRAVDGTPVWTSLFNGAGNGDDYASSLVVDGSGNVYVTGYSTNSGSGYDYATLKYSSAGIPQWTNLFNGAGNSTDIARSLAVDGSGNVYVTGSSIGSGSGYDYATIKYSSAGIPQWTNVFNGAGNSYDQAYSLAVDGSGNVYVTGYSTNSGSSNGYAILKYSNAGIPLWTNFFNGAGNYYDQASSLVVDGSGNVYVVGFSTGSGADYVTLKYSSIGIPLWTNCFNGAGNFADYAKSLAVDGSGNVYVTGYSYGSASGFDYATLKYSSAGVTLWTNLFNSAGNNNDFANSLAVDGSGNVYITGYSTGSGNSADYATLKYSSAGIPLWTNFFNSAGNNNDYAISLAVDGSDNVYVTGFLTGGESGADYATLKYSSAGVALWTNLFNGAANSDDRAQSLAVDGSGNVYVAGYSTGSASGYDYATIKYSGPPIPPSITATILTGGNMSLSFEGLAGTNYALDRTFNLSPTVNWVPQVTNPAGAGGVLIFTNTPNPATNNFWRIRSVP